MQIQADDIITLVVSITLIFLIGGLFLVIYVNLYNEKKRRHAEEKELLAQQFSQTLLETQLEIKEQTLQHIAYELHDNLGQMASLIKINLNTLQLDDTVKTKQKIEDTKDLVRQLIADLKSLSLNLNSDRIAQLGIIKGLEDEVDRLNKTGQFEAVLHHSGSSPELNSNTTIILYRMVQEIINNIVKHSGAKRITISVEATGNLFTLVCIDDGAGFDAKETIKKGGSGLINLRSRAKLINAHLVIQSSTKNGTKISIELPL
jgi:signal transduction histidine kinase